MDPQAVLFISRFDHALRNIAMAHGLDGRACDAIKQAVLMENAPECLSLWAESPESDIREAARIRVQQYAREHKQIN
mgnify:CR=1 FL=1